jgi:hypothetical protein
MFLHFKVIYNSEMENLLKNRNLAGLLQFQPSSFFPSAPGGNQVVQPNFNVGQLQFHPSSFFFQIKFLNQFMN